MFEANFDGIRSLVVGLSAVMLFGGCFPTDDEEMGEQGKVLFHVIGDYSGTATLSEAPFCVDCAVFLELSDPSVGQNSLLADLKLSVEPSDAGEVIRLNGGRVLLVPHKAGEFKLVAKRDGLALDWLTLHAAETASMSLVDGTRWTERWDGSSYPLRRESVDIDSQLSLGTNQWLGVTLLPQDKDGNVLRGIVDFTVPSGS